MSYVSPMALRQARGGYSRNRNAVRFSSTQQGLGPVSNILLLAVALALMGLLYLTQVTKSNEFGFELDRLETAKSSLIVENQSLRVETARLQALERIEKSEVVGKLQQPDSIEHIQAQ